MGPRITVPKMPKPSLNSSFLFRKPNINRDSILFPAFDSVPYPSTTEKLASFIKPPNSLRRSGPQSVQNVVVIGVHGYFPGKVARAVLGEPTGTSVKFVGEACSAVKSIYPACNIEEIALVGEGRIEQRIEFLYIQLKSYLKSIKKADLVLFAAHSQGSVVTVGLVHRLLDSEILVNQKVTIMSMAGVFCGPVVGLDQSLAMKAISRIEHESLLELFDLQKDQSKVSQQLRESLTRILSFGAKIVLISSADDQLVPMYSALATNVSHPNLFRAVYLDQSIDPMVIEPLLQLAVRKLNLGDTDHGVVKELSPLLAGRMVSSGHSNIYAHPNCYKLAVRVSTETRKSAGVFPEFLPRNTEHNPFVLPWVARALIDEADGEYLAKLQKEMLEWKPKTKQLKELKFRLGGLKSKL